MHHMHSDKDDRTLRLNASSECELEQCAQHQSHVTLLISSTEQQPASRRLGLTRSIVAMQASCDTVAPGRQRHSGRAHIVLLSPFQACQAVWKIDDVWMLPRELADYNREEGALVIVARADERQLAEHGELEPCSKASSTSATCKRKAPHQQTCRHLMHACPHLACLSMQTRHARQSSQSYSGHICIMTAQRQDRPCIRSMQHTSGASQLILIRQ